MEFVVSEVPAAMTRAAASLAIEEHEPFLGRSGDRVLVAFDPVVERRPSGHHRALVSRHRSKQRFLAHAALWEQSLKPTLIFRYGLEALDDLRELPIHFGRRGYRPDRLILQALCTPVPEEDRRPGGVEDRICLALERRVGRTDRSGDGHLEAERGIMATRAAKVLRAAEPRIKEQHLAKRRHLRRIRRILRKGDGLWSAVCFSCAKISDVALGRERRARV